MDEELRRLNIISRIKDLRQELQMNQKEFSQLVGVSGWSISMLERGHTDFSKRTFDKYEKALQGDPKKILTEIEENVKRRQLEESQKIKYTITATVNIVFQAELNPKIFGLATIEDWLREDADWLKEINVTEMSMKKA